MIEILTSILVLTGLLFMFAGSLGIYRLQDFYGRAHASGKSSTLGAILMMLASIVYFTGKTGHLSFKQVLIALFIFFTAPVATHMMSRAAYFTGVKMWEGSVLDEMQGYEPPEEENAGKKARRQEV